MGPSPIDPMINEPAATEAVMQMHAANEAATLRSRFLKTAALTVAPLVLAACAHLPKDDVRADEATTTTEQVNPTTTANTTTTAPESNGSLSDAWDKVQAEEAMDQLNDTATGFGQGEMGVGEDGIDWSLITEGAGARAIVNNMEGQTIGDGDKILETPEEVGELIRSNTNAGEKTRLQVLAAFQEAGIPERFQEEAATGKCFVPFQIKAPGILNDTTYIMENGDLAILHDDRGLKAGDVFWGCFVEVAGADGKDHIKFLPGSVIRALCFNPSSPDVKIRKRTPDQPDTPDVEYGPKDDDNITIAGVPGQNPLSGTAPSGPTGPGVGRPNQPRGPLGRITPIDTEEPVKPPKEVPVIKDPNSPTGPAPKIPGVEQAPVDSAPKPTAPVSSVPVKGGQGGPSGGTGNV